MYHTDCYQNPAKAWKLHSCFCTVQGRSQQCIGFRWGDSKGSALHSGTDTSFLLTPHRYTCCCIIHLPSSATEQSFVFTVTLRMIQVTDSSHATAKLYLRERWVRKENTLFSIQYSLGLFFIPKSQSFS